uniref:PNPLA domain-containing protein n=1 Tax=Magallana gigas TaxID=29159 RepID=A0A8W8MH37_MAGGI
MGNVFGSQVEPDPGDIRNKEILEARKRYLDEQFKLDDEKEFGNAKPNPSGVNRKLRRMPSILNEIEKKAMSINPKDHSFPFENPGAVKALEELGLVSQIKRFAGASAGAMTASLLAVGNDSKDLQGFLNAKFGILSLLPNLLTGYGWNPAARLYNWFGELMQQRRNLL